MTQRMSFKNLPKVQAKRFKKLRLEKERAQATHWMVRQAGKRSRRRKD